MNRVKAAIIEGTRDLAAREALRTFPGRYFRVAAETCDDPSDRHSIMWRLVELYDGYVRQRKREVEAMKADVAALRRSHLRIVDPQPAPTGPPPVQNHHTEGA